MFGRDFPIFKQLKFEELDNLNNYLQSDLQVIYLRECSGYSLYIDTVSSVSRMVKNTGFNWNYTSVLLKWIEG